MTHATLSQDSPVKVDRTNETLAVLRRNAAALLRRVSRGITTDQDAAMAGIYAQQLDRRRRR